jgi:beta-fructofuranosidase
MGFELSGHYVWDFWVARDGSESHLFFLTAPKLGDSPDLRHPRARIGHAISTDLTNWTYQGVVIRASEAPAWDDGVTWTGSVVKRPDGMWMMFYTGCSRAEGMKIQRIGAAVSEDLRVWKKLDGPLLELDPRFYETYDPARWHDQAFRDPWVYRNPSGDSWCMLFTARDPDGPPRGAGVIGRARSRDLIHWTQEPPLFGMDRFGEMEVTQLFFLDGWWYCLFSNSVRHREPGYIITGKAGHVTGTHYLRSRSPEGPFEMPEEEFFAGDDASHLYGGRAVEAADGCLVFLAFLNYDSDGHFVGQITDPMPIWTTPEGYLRVDATKYGVPLRPSPAADQDAGQAVAIPGVAAAISP